MELIAGEGPEVVEVETGVGRGRTGGMIEADGISHGWNIATDSVWNEVISFTDDTVSK